MAYYPGSVPPAVAVTAAGTNQATATEVTAGVTSIVAGAATVGLRLPAAAAGTVCSVYNTHASNGILIYPHVGGDINDGTENAAVTIEGKTLALFECLDGTTWAAIFTANS